jgi:acetyl esterase/lipase
MVFRIELTQSIAYAERSRHRLDVCRPRQAVGAPVIVFFYGGAWRSGYKELYRYVAKALAGRRLHRGDVASAASQRAAELEIASI